MFQKLLRFFHNPQRNNQRILRHMDGLIRGINDLEEEYRGLSDEELAQKTQEFKEMHAQGKSLDSLLVPAFATVREAARRVLGMRPFDVQLRGGIALHQGMIAEMKTGEGKTLVGTLPVYLNALTGKGVHVVTVNDYLAQRDSSVMRPLYEFLGLSVGCIVQDLSHSQRYAAYHSDITYGTNNEFGFDYLKDNMKFSPGEMCQRGFSYAIVDEVDSILIDEARTPLIISGPAEDASHLYDVVNGVIGGLEPLHYEIDEKNKSVAFTDAGYVAIERMTREAGLVSGKELFQSENLMLVHHLNQSLKAHKTFHRDIDYIVKDGKVVLIDEFTGRMMKGRRYSDGLHQALEAKEGVEIEVENQTLASITFQNFFRMYDKLAGMTGTAETEAAEFHDIYKLPVLSIPTNVPVARKDLDDEIFRTFSHKLQVILKQIKECHDRQQPVLVGTLSIEKSEIFAEALKKLNIPFHVLNARHHEQEAKIIAQAGAPGAITIATNMAGRGTDIKLGGNLEVMLEEALEGVEGEEERREVEQAVRAKQKEQEEVVRRAGGLFVLGTERNENRRIDNQLRGRSGRQGDFGASKFFISLEDDLMRIFGPNLKMLDYSLRSNEGENEPITHPWLTRSIEKAQQRVEAQHFDTRKHLLKYADVLNAQRTAVYDERHVLMHAEEVHDRAMDMANTLVREVVGGALDEKKSPTEWNWSLLGEELEYLFGLTLKFTDQERVSPEAVREKITTAVMQRQEQFEEQWGLERRMRMEKSLMLKTLDQTWIGHLNAMDHLRSGIHLQAYGQKDPLNEYRHEAFVMFKGMKNHWYRNFLHMYFHANPDYVEQYEEEDDGIEALLKKWSLQYNSEDEESEESEDLEHFMETNSTQTQGEEEVDYKKILDKLLAEDRKWDRDAFEEEHLDTLGFGRKGGKKSKANSSDTASKISKGTKKDPKEMGNKKEKPSGVKIGAAKPSDSKTKGKGVAKEEGRSEKMDGARQGGKAGAIKRTPRTTSTGPIANSPRNTKAPGKSTGQDLGVGRKGAKTAGGVSTAGGLDSRKTPALGTSSGKLPRSKVGVGGSSSRTLTSGRSTEIFHDMDDAMSFGAPTQARAQKKVMKRRAPSKRGPYVPKNDVDSRNMVLEVSSDRKDYGYGEPQGGKIHSPQTHGKKGGHRSYGEERSSEQTFGTPAKKSPGKVKERRRTAVGRGPANRGIPAAEREGSFKDLGFERFSKGAGLGSRGAHASRDGKSSTTLRDPKTRWQSAGSGAQRPGRSASTRPAFDSWKVKGPSLHEEEGFGEGGGRFGTKAPTRTATSLGERSGRTSGGGFPGESRSRGKFGQKNARDTSGWKESTRDSKPRTSHPRDRDEGARDSKPRTSQLKPASVKHGEAKESHSLLQKFYTSRMEGGGRAFARSPMGKAQRSERKESLDMAAASGLSYRSKAFKNSVGTKGAKPTVALSEPSKNKVWEKNKGGRAPQGRKK